VLRFAKFNSDDRVGVFDVWFIPEEIRVPVRSGPVSRLSPNSSRPVRAWRIKLEARFPNPAGGWFHREYRWAAQMKWRPTETHVRELIKRAKRYHKEGREEVPSDGTQEGAKMGRAESLVPVRTGLRLARPEGDS
jgi:hypothetical protein